MILLVAIFGKELFSQILLLKVSCTLKQRYTLIQFFYFYRFGRSDFASFLGLLPLVIAHVSNRYAAVGKTVNENKLII
jgi:hypothetical protein